MNSKEALSNIEKLFIGSPINPTQQIEIIEKDLDQLEKLEKENQKLKEQVNHFEKIIKEIKNLPGYIGIGFKNMFDNCKLTPLPELPELEKYYKELKELEK